ncbi:MAG: hypothetical protein HY322_01735 [Betaproteobacteria bacterium]|nr:hypothetical protein [Betaproteobacteria bacterium]
MRSGRNGSAFDSRLWMVRHVYSHGHVAASEPHWTQNSLRARAIHELLAVKIAK